MGILQSYFILELLELLELLEFLRVLQNLSGNICEFEDVK